MGEANWFILPIAGLIPLILGYIWYHPKVLGDRLAQVTGEKRIEKKTTQQILFIYLFGIVLAYILTLMSVHQTAIFQLFFMDPALADSNSEYNQFIQDFLSKYGTRHRSFGHGLIHGAEAGLMFGLSFLGITALLQGKSLKLIWIHLVFWVLCCGLVAGTTCAFF